MVSQTVVGVRLLLRRLLCPDTDLKEKLKYRYGQKLK